MNRVQLLGRLGKDPETKTVGNSQKVSNLVIATDESFKRQNGEWEKKTEWHNLVAWGKVADNVEKNGLRKGDAIFIEGKLQTRTWEDKDGNKRYATEIYVLSIAKISLPGKDNAAGSTNTSNYNNEQSNSSGHTIPASQIDDDLPF